MAGIPSNLRIQLRKTLLDCGPFASNDDLRHVFVDERIEPWVDGLPQARSKERRVDGTIDYLLKEARADTGENVLVLFVHVIRDGTHPQRACYRRLSDLAAALGAALQDDTDAPDRPTKTPSQTPPTQSTRPPAVQPTSANHDPPQKPPAPLAGRNGDDAGQKNRIELLQQRANKLFVLNILSFLGNIFTIFDLPEDQKFWFRLGLTILAGFSGLPIFVWDRSQRSVRVVKLLFVVLVTVLCGWFTFQPYVSYVDNSCPNVRLTASQEQIKPGESAKLTVQADDPEHDALDYTWQATVSGLDKKGGPYDSPLNEYTAPSSAAGKTVKITAIVDDNQCGEQVLDETTIRIVLPDN